MDKIYQKIFSGGKTAGFTLIELLIVVFIIGVLAAVALPKYQAAVERAKWAEIFNAERSVAAAQDRYYLANGHYSDSFSELDINYNGIDSSGRYITGRNFRAVLRPSADGVYGEFQRLNNGVVDLSVNLLTIYGYPDRAVARQCRVQDQNNKTGNQICSWLSDKPYQTPTAENRYYF